MYKTKLIVELEISTQFGPNDAIKVFDSMINFPCIDSAQVIGISSEWKPNKNTCFESVNLQSLVNIPKKLK